ncbi:hypothetical protein [Paenibacillus naphthalenovorans]|uniref:Uncharacterized protein n=1 Tax=Paenibacillus naphthalenovorans TaxID=162209 RepID=A0A0U2U729_9BACL|nr:hypothetical protein [Paenibacillus naphthalenovorans]ALS22169.1 hypothetical protein IJ22_17950 [Paenibacillus naphthalenovorans]
MNEDQKYNYFRDSYIDFITAMFNCEISAMNAENKQREVQGDSMAYIEEDYYKVSRRYKMIVDKYIEKMNKDMRKMKSL